MVRKQVQSSKTISKSCPFTNDLELNISCPCHKI